MCTLSAVRSRAPSDSASRSAITSRSTPSAPVTCTPRSHVRWFRPTWSSRTWSGATPNSFAKRRWNPIATLHRPTARCPASSRARVTMPTGLVKSTIQASGLAYLRTSSAYSRTTGTVRSAFAKPPGPVVSCPMQQASCGHVSSCCRAACPPMRSWNMTASASLTPATTSSVTWIVPGWPACANIRLATPPTSSRRTGSGSTSQSSSMGSWSRSRAKPSTSSGV